MKAAEPSAVAASVLVVDDIESNLIAMSAVLGPLGIRVVKAQSGAEALAKLAEETFAVVLLDVQMPEIDGFEVARRIRQLEAGSEVPIIFLTAIHRDEAQVRRGYAIGAADYITKPFDIDVLRARVRAFVDLYRQREEVRRAQVALRTRERDEAERRVVAFERITTAAFETHDLSALLHELLAIYLDGADSAESASIFLSDGDGRLRAVTSATRDGSELPQVSHRADEGFAVAVAVSKVPLELSSETDEASPLRASVASAPGIFYGIPLLADGELLGVVQTSAERAASFTEREKRLFQAVAERARWAVSKHSERSRLRSILHSAPALIAIFRGPEQTGEFFNPRFAELVASEHALGQPAHALGLSAILVSMLRHAYESGESVSQSELPLLDLTAGNVEPRFVNVMAQPLRGPTGVTDSTLLFAVDMTEQVRARQQIEAHQTERAVLLERERQARSDAEFANRAKDEFLATLSHELRTPMNAVLGWTARARAKAPPDLDRALAIVERNAQAQSRLIEDMLDLSRIISGKLRLELSTFVADEPVQGAIEAIRPAAEAKGVELRAQVEDVGEIFADPERVQQVVWNLLSNAVKFTPNGGTVSLIARAENQNFVVRVADTGQGIEPEFLPHVFDRFRQADGSTTRRHGGLGLGLAIVKQLAQAHGGSVHALSEGVGKGSEFVFELPMRHAAVMRRRPTPVRSEAPTTGLTNILRALSGLRVLVVDDEQDARALLSEMLSEQGARVAEASSARLALGLMDEFEPDLVVSDIGMPEMDGFALIRELRAKQKTNGERVPAIALTAYARTEDVENVLSAGFDRHLAKPVDLTMLLSAVADLARHPPREA